MARFAADELTYNESNLSLSEHLGMSTIIENLSAGEKREALNLVFQSQTFSRSDRLKNLLRFICEAEIEGRCNDLNEYAIGVEALGRPPGFSPARIPRYAAAPTNSGGNSKSSI
jgi:hypothetical protein